jgi:predicted Ser/Thr protein kinase
MVVRLQQYGIAHGDLQHGNILVKDAEMKLVDYDGMYVPRLRTFLSNELGHPNYQHPARSGKHFGPYLDNFSAWVIHTSLLCLSIDPSLWKKLSGGDDCLLFRRRDFEEPLSSAAFRQLEDHGSDQIKASAKLLRYLLMYPPEQVPNLDANLLHVNQLPAIKEPIIELAVDQSAKVEIAPAGGSGLPGWMQPGPVGPTKVQSKQVNLTGTWPRFDEYKQAIQEPIYCFHDEELKQGRLVPQAKGLGLNGFVFHLRCQNRQVAVKCYKQSLPDRERRFESIAKYARGAAKRYFVDFRYLPQGIRVGDYWYPILVMDWVAPTLNDYIHANLHFKKRLASLSERFKNMVRALQIVGIAHGDLEPGNLVFTNGEFKLLDYDGMYVPELEGLNGIERGHPGYQHPSRKVTDFGPNLDNFSAWLLDAELSYLAVEPQVWLEAEMRAQQALKGTSKAEDKDKEVHPSKQVRMANDVLRTLLDYDFDTIPAFDPTVPIFIISKRPGI